VAVTNLPVVPSVPDFEVRVSVDGSDYLFRYRWNHRAESWFLDLLDADGVLLLAGRRLTVDSSILEQYRHLPIPQGRLVPWDTTDRGLDPAFVDLGERVLMRYLDPSEDPDSV
jgi:hypothetical protein